MVARPRGFEPHLMNSPRVHSIVVVHRPSKAKARVRFPVYAVSHPPRPPGVHGIKDLLDILRLDHLSILTHFVVDETNSL